MEDKQKANILESLATAVLITDKDFNIHYANTAAEQLCGVSRTKLISSKFYNTKEFLSCQKVMNAYLEGL